MRTKSHTFYVGALRFCNWKQPSNLIGFPNLIPLLKLPFHKQIFWKEATEKLLRVLLNGLGLKEKMKKKRKNILNYFGDSQILLKQRWNWRTKRTHGIWIKSSSEVLMVINTLQFQQIRGLSTCRKPPIVSLTRSGVYWELDKHQYVLSLYPCSACLQFTHCSYPSRTEASIFHRQ